MSTNGELLLLKSVISVRRAFAPLTILDVGANVGDWSLEALSIARTLGIEVTVHAFEPHPQTRSKLKERLSSSGAHSATIHEVALSDRTATQRFHVVAPLAGANSFHELPGIAQTAIDVRSVSLTDFARERDIGRVDFIKIDTEGHDMFVLKGGLALFAERRVGAAQFEYNARWVASRTFLRDVFDLAEGTDYVLGKVTPLGIEFYKAWHDELEMFREANYVLCLREIAQSVPSLRWWND